MLDQIAALLQTVTEQQKQLDAQRVQLKQQEDLIRQLQDVVARASEPEQVAESENLPVDNSDVAIGIGAQMSDVPSSEISEGDRAALAELNRREMEGTANPPVDSQVTLYDPSSSVFDPNFRGAWHLPGTTAAMKVGGYVNVGLVNSLDPLLARDRFIVGSIPADGATSADARKGTSVAANQTRFNLEVREQTTNGQLRAFIEGDFLGAGDQFRLRHAYGQYAWALAGQTWTAFSNMSAFPEGVDFEGVNGAVLARQSQLRISPMIGKDLNLIVSFENPTTEVNGGEGEQGIPDIVVSVDKLPLGGVTWNYKVAAIFRNLKAVEGGPASTLPTRTTTGWGVTTSGRLKPSGWQDSLLWQFTYGEGVGRYLNDLGVIGGGDAVFDPDGTLRALPVFAGSLSYQHEWTNRLTILSSWPGLMRSNLTFSWIDIDNYEFQSDSDYNSTLYAAANLIYFPTQNIRVGAEYLWGRRKNKDGSAGWARQVQLSARFSF